MVILLESKYWLERPSPDICQALRLANLESYDPQEIRKTAGRLSNTEGKKHRCSDNFYIRWQRAKDTASFDSVYRLDFVDGKFRFDGTSIDAVVDCRWDFMAEAIAFRTKLKRSLEKLDSGQEDPIRFPFKVSETDEGIYLSMTRNIRKGVYTDEFIFQVQSVSDALRFLEFMGYDTEPSLHRKKTYESFSYVKSGVYYTIDISTVDFLPRVRFLEIEARTPYGKTMPETDEIVKIAESLGIRNSNLMATDGGNLENRGYNSLLRILKDNRLVSKA